jgi:hypothetical protein
VVENRLELPRDLLALRDERGRDLRYSAAFA